MLFSKVKRDIFYFKKNKSNFHYRKMYLLLYNLIKICQKIQKGKYLGVPKRGKHHSKLKYLWRDKTTGKQFIQGVFSVGNIFFEKHVSVQTHSSLS